MNFLKYFFIFINLVCGQSLFFILARAELLVVKQGQDGSFMPLEKSDEKHNAIIVETLIKYQWPMCIASASELTEQEKDELCAADNRHQEELFIQRKIREKMGDEYSVIFIPTALYELFCILHIFEGVDNEEGNPFRDKVDDICFDLRNAKEAETGWKIDVQGALQASADTFFIQNRLDEMYKKVNSFFYDSDNTEKNPIFFVNNELVKLLLDVYPDLKNSDNAQELSTMIEQRAQEIASFFTNKLIACYNQLGDWSFQLPYHNNPCLEAGRESPRKFMKNLLGEEKNKLIMRVINLEYEARRDNKALLLRGLRLIPFQLGLGVNPRTALLLGASLKQPEKSCVKGSGLVIRSFENAYRDEKNSPYSISFGNSLFGGSLRDSSACVYSFLQVGPRRPASGKVVGFALLIDKKAYLKNRCENLFFIAPVSSIASLLQEGEFFHSRSKPSVARLSQEKTDVWGIFGGLHDATGQMLVERDPLLHAELIARYIAENGRIIQTGDENTFSAEERAFPELIKQNQLEAALFYKRTRLLKKVIDRRIRSWKEKKKSPLSASPGKNDDVPV